MTAGRYSKWNESWRPESEVQNIGDQRSEDVGRRIKPENQRTEAVRSNWKEAGRSNHKVVGWSNQKKRGWTVKPEGKRLDGHTGRRLDSQTRRSEVGGPRTE
jgi:hypothetical protein